MVRNRFASVTQSIALRFSISPSQVATLQAEVLLHDSCRLSGNEQAPYDQCPPTGVDGADFPVHICVDGGVQISEQDFPRPLAKEQWVR